MAPRSRKNASSLSRWCCGIGRVPLRHFLICCEAIPSSLLSINDDARVRHIIDRNSLGVINGSHAGARTLNIEDAARCVSRAGVCTRASFHAALDEWLAGRLRMEKPTL